jgi:hypothetical protein
MREAQAVQKIARCFRAVAVRNRRSYRQRITVGLIHGEVDATLSPVDEGHVLSICCCEPGVLAACSLLRT